MSLALNNASASKFFYKSDLDAPTQYISYLPQFAEQFKEKGKGVVFFGSSFVVGLMGDKEMVKLDIIEEQCAAMSSKPIKKMVKDKVSFKFKEKGKKPINASGVASFMITGADFDTGRLTELFENQEIVPLM